jgi:transcriptional regulator with XRE-family HTH domain
MPMNDGGSVNANQNEVRSMRLTRGFTQRVLADKAGVSQQAVAKWEAGDTEISLRNAERLAQALGVSKEAIFPSLRKSLSVEGERRLMSEVMHDVMPLQVFIAFEVPTRRVYVPPPDQATEPRYTTEPGCLRWFRYIVTHKELNRILNGLEDPSDEWLAFESVDRMFVVLNTRQLAFVRCGNDLYGLDDENGDELIEPQLFRDGSELEPDELEDSDPASDEQAEERFLAELDTRRAFRLFLRRGEPIIDYGGFREEPDASGLVGLFQTLELAGDTTSCHVVRTYNADEGDVWFAVNSREIQLLEGPIDLFDEWTSFHDAEMGIETEPNLIEDLVTKPSAAPKKKPKARAKKRKP